MTAKASTENDLVLAGRNNRIYRSPDTLSVENRMVSEQTSYREHIPRLCCQSFSLIPLFPIRVEQVHHNHHQRDSHSND